MLLFAKKNSYLGIDLGTSSIKIIELKNEKGRAHLTTYGYADNLSEIVKNRTTEGIIKIAAIMAKICQQIGASTIKSITALPTFSVFNSIINLPHLSKKELSQTVVWEAKKVIPLAIEEMILDWKILDHEEKSKTDKSEEDKKAKFTKILLTGAPKDLVKRYMGIFKEAGLNLLSLETEVFALIRSLVGNDKSVLMIVDIGALTTTISIIENGVPSLNRSIDIGGWNLTQTLSSRLNIDFFAAEQIKCDLGLKDLISEEADPATQVIESVLSPIINEIKYSFNLYQGQGLKVIEKIILTGGSSLLANLPEYLSRLLNVRVYLGDPWARIVYPEELKPVLDEIGPRFAVAIGLAMRDIE